jgi:hypothetical protein
VFQYGSKFTVVNVVSIRSEANIKWTLNLARLIGA